MDEVLGDSSEEDNQDREGEDAPAAPGVAQPPKPVRRRGNAIAWKYVKTFENMDTALDHYSKEKLMENGLIRGRKSYGKSTVLYYNCQKMSCGCKKKWRILTSQTSDAVTEEETYDEHTSHELFARNGGFGMTFDQVRLIHEALARCPMKPIQILRYFDERATEAANAEPPQEVVLPPRIAQITSFVSFQKKKRLAAIREQPPILASNEVISPVQPQPQPRIIPVPVPVTVTVPLAVSSPAESV